MDPWLQSSCSTPRRKACALPTTASTVWRPYAYTRDLGRAFRVAEGLEYGIVGINDGLPSSAAPHVPFGGMKNSGVGREGGHWGLEEYLETKFISLGLV